MRLLFTSVAVAILGAATASAQERQAALVVVDTGAPEATVRRWRTRVEASLPAEPVDLERWVLARQPPGTVEPSRLEVVAEVQRLLVEGKAAAARLRERDALRILARAESVAERHLDIPGMAAWYAEIQLAVAITAAQVELGELSEAALRRAASVDPSRRVQAAEALPEVVGRARAAVRAAATGPRGRFEVRADVPGAVVSLDDEVLGPLPRVVDAPVGPHVLRIDAPGHRGWARVFTVFEGERPPVRVRLAPSALMQRARRVREAARAGNPRTVASLLAEVPAPALRVWVLWPGSGPRDRAVLLGCDAGRCGAVRRLEAEGPAASPGLGEARGQLSEALRWMEEPLAPAIARDRPWWERWYVWVGVGAVMAAGAAAAVAAQPDGEGPWDIRVDPSSWAPFADGDVD